MEKTKAATWAGYAVALLCMVGVVYLYITGKAPQKEVPYIQEPTQTTPIRIKFH